MSEGDDGPGRVLAADDVKETGSGPAFSGPQRWAVLAAFALLVAFRLPKAWVHGRFQDEEATVFLAYAWHFPWADALFRPFAGYWNLAGSAISVLTVWLVRSGVLPLEQAPYLTMSIALAAQLMPAALILTGKAPWLTRRIAVIAALLIIGTLPATEEIFFNILHIQFHFALCVALILALDVPTRRRARIGYGVLLFLGPLCGPGSIVLLPLFALRAAIDGGRGRAVQLAVLAAGSAIQLLLFFGSSSLRGHVADPATLAAAMFVRLIALPLLGVGLTNWVANAIHGSELAGGNLWWGAAAAAIVLFTALLAIAARRRDGAVWLVLSALALATVSLGFGIVIVNPADVFSVVEGERYNFLPLALLGLAIIALWTRPGFKGKSACAVLGTVMLLNGAIAYRKPAPAFADGPAWPTEVAAWRANHDHPLAVWPRPWTADLSDKSRACSPTTPDLARSDDPRYCESGWIAAFYRRN